MACHKWLGPLLCLTQAIGMVTGASIPSSDIQRRANGASDVGCFTDSETWWRVLIPVETVVSTDMTVEKCLAACDHYQIFSLKDGDTCYCGNYFNGDLAQVDHSRCSVVCPGDSSEACGAQTLLSVYKRIGATNDTATAITYSSATMTGTIRSSKASAATSTKIAPASVSAASSAMRSTSVTMTAPASGASSSMTKKSTLSSASLTQAASLTRLNSSSIASTLSSQTASLTRLNSSSIASTSSAQTAAFTGFNSTFTSSTMSGPRTSALRTFSSFGLNATSVTMSMTGTAARQTSSSVSGNFTIANSTSATSTRTSSTQTSSSTVPSVASKRGLLYNNVNVTNLFTGPNSKVVWGYNLDDVTTNPFPQSWDFVPTLFSDDPGYTAPWNEDANEMITAGSTHLFAFNEPDVPTQANMTPAAAAQAYKTWMQPFAGKAKLGAPAVTNGDSPMGLTWLKQFMGNCTGCTIDFVPFHWYGSATNFVGFKSYVEQVHNSTTLPIWISEFATNGTSDQQVTFLQKTMPWLDSLNYIERYAYFVAFVDYGLASETQLNQLGATFMNYTSTTIDPVFA